MCATTSTRARRGGAHRRRNGRRLRGLEQGWARRARPEPEQQAAAATTTTIIITMVTAALLWANSRARSDHWSYYSAPPVLALRLTLAGAHSLLLLPRSLALSLSLSLLELSLPSRLCPLVRANSSSPLHVQRTNAAGPGPFGRLATPPSQPPPWPEPLPQTLELGAPAAIPTRPALSHWRLVLLRRPIWLALGPARFWFAFVIQAPPGQRRARKKQSC